MSITNERRLDLALEIQGHLAAELKQMRAWRDKWRRRARAGRDRVCELTTELADARSAVDAARTRQARDTTDLRTQLDAATKRAELAEATLESVRAAVAKPVEVEQDGPPKAGDMVPWSEVEAGCLYYGDSSYPFRMVIEAGSMLQSGPDDPEIDECLAGDYLGKDMSDTRAIDGSTVLIARDLGTDPEVWRAAMREHLAKAGK